MGVVANLEYRGLDEVLKRLARFATGLGYELHPERRIAERLTAIGPNLADSLEVLDWILTLGGDGTFLRGAHLAGPRGLPVLGCNLGRLGFLTMVAQEELGEALEHLARGEYEEDLRLALEIRVRAGANERRKKPTAEEHDPSSVGARAPDRAPDSTVQPDGSFYALNDAVIHKSGFARMITLHVWADEEELGRYSADGIIVATPTGSTAYSLSAGGPILVPSMDGLVTTPISPHTLAVRPVVLPGETRVSVELLSDEGDIALTVDGQTGSQLQAGDRVEVERSRHDLRLLRFPRHSFFSVMRRKLRWGDVRPVR